MSQKQALDAQRAAYNAEQAELAAEAAAAKAAPDVAAVVRFEQRETGVGAGSSDIFRLPGGGSGGPASVASAVEHLKNKVDGRDKVSRAALARLRVAAPQPGSACRARS